MLPDVPCGFSLYVTGLLKSDNMVEERKRKSKLGHVYIHFL